MYRGIESRVRGETNGGGQGKRDSRNCPDGWKDGKHRLPTREMKNEDRLQDENKQNRLKGKRNWSPCIAAAGLTRRLLSTTAWMGWDGGRGTGPGGLGLLMAGGFFTLWRHSTLDGLVGLCHSSVPTAWNAAERYFRFPTQPSHLTNNHPAYHPTASSSRPACRPASPPSPSAGLPSAEREGGRGRRPEYLGGGAWRDISN